ncbi:MAG: DevR family CRISPR-associated autoregulator [Phaeodactylibacter sp.]|nr:DevR family CRISPR-associated autoregulator [Phaeodactylibacter sp.]
MSTVQNLSLVGRLTINLASLNNEGSEGNATQPRTATVVQGGQLYSVPVISGDMLKHWHAEHLSRIAQERDLPLSSNSNRRNPDPNRIKSELNDIKWVTKNIPESEGLSGSIKGTDRQPLETALYREVARGCVVTDAHGLLITEIAPKGEDGKDIFNASVAVARTSRVQVGFMVGVPSKSVTKHYFHTKFVSTRTGQQARESGSNEGQNIFTRPASSAEYAVVINVDLAGLGFDDALNDYVISEEERRKRQKAVLDALSYTLLSQPGANSSQQFPHVMDFIGAIVTSNNRLPAPTVSPLKEEYLEVLGDLVEIANTMNGGASIELQSVQGLNEAVKVLTEIGASL